MTTGARIRMYRIAADMTLEELATKVGVRKQTINKYEKDIVVNIPAARLQAMANVLGVSLAQLTTDTAFLDQDDAEILEGLMLLDRRGNIIPNAGRPEPAKVTSNYDLLSEENRRLVDSMIEQLLKAQSK